LREPDMRIASPADYASAAWSATLDGLGKLQA
jgi:hypothetical protein